MLQVQVALEQSLLAREDERVGNAQLVAVAHANRDVEDLEQAAAELADGQAVERVDVRDPDVVDRHDHDPLVQGMCELDLCPERERRGLGVWVQEHPDPGDPDHRRLLVRQTVEELGQRALLGDPLAGHDELAPAPVDHHQRE